ncbi:MAG: lytic transglycosylase [endosymbiont of Seepiophila jonesi]|uniref:Lytic transglycosylase n=1 Tax=endosymbiont of Lamellibrachia luymesi TaxID=2200907 RepID=A0A370DPF0_9GAMM|nr:MAG: lytic transglycosylase [endosymbiont of Lamellibrachia luymesi]RDH93734.1 MAG: lytic transglycosylase [endosymbiont of Seepiophila jonesi]
MTRTNRNRALLLCLLAGMIFSQFASSAADNRTTTLSESWKNYLSSADSTEPSKHFPYLHCFRRAATTHDLPLTLLLAVSRGESDFDPAARSHANAHGLMQIQWPGTAKHLGINRIADLYNPCRNVDAGTRYLKELLARYNNDLHLALAAYNYGPGRISKTGGGDIPDGAEWYSRYIYRHLTYVTDINNRGSTEPQQPYSAEKRRVLIEFNRPYRVEAYVSSLQKRFPDLRFDWFKLPEQRFRVAGSLSSMQMRASRLRHSRSCDTQE